MRIQSKAIRLVAGLLLAMIAVVLSATGASAQTTKGTIAGIVTDPSGAVVQGATVTATPTAGGESRTATTGSQGEYRIELLLPGEYTVTVKASGFAELKAEKVAVRTSVVTSQNLQLSVPRGSDVITVDASVQQVQTETGELSKTIETRQVTDVPYVNLNPYSLAVTLPGVTTVATRDDFTNGTSFSVNGLRPRANNFLVDGFDNNDNGIAGQAFQPNNIEAVQEVTVLTNSYSAEFGRGGGSVSNLTFRSGSNSFHGGVWEQYNASALDAVAPEDSLTGVTRVPQYVNNIFGFRFGGPIKKDKLFFFGTSQWNRFFGAVPTTTIQVPTAAGVSTLQSIGANSMVDLMLQTMGPVRGTANTFTVPIGGRAGCAAPCNVEFGDFKRQDHVANPGREWTVRVDYSPSASDNFFVRYTDSMVTLTPDFFNNSAVFPTQDTQVGGPARILGAMWAHTFSSRVVNEFRFSAQQLDFGFNPTATAAASPIAHVADIYFADSTGMFVGGFSNGGLWPQGRGHKTFQFQDGLSIMTGSHTLKLGTDVALLLIRDQIPFNSDGFFVVSSGGDCSALAIGTAGGLCTDLANYVDGFSGPSSGSALNKSFGNPRISVPTSQMAFYAQDTWKVRPNVTLDFGLRYEYQPPDESNVLPYPAVDRNTLGAANFLTRYEQKADRNNFAPRFGFAYTPRFWSGLFGNDKTVIRGGAGIYYDTFFTNISNNTAATSPNSLGGTINPAGGRGIADALGAINAIAAASSPLTARTTIDQDLINPVTYQWNLNVQRELPLKLLMEVAYVGTRGEHLWVNEQLNPRSPSHLGVLGGFVNGPRQDTSIGSLVIRGNRGDSIYHGLQATVSRNVGSLALRGSYTWSRAIDNQSEVFASSGGASRWQNVNDPRSDRGPSVFNRTHRAVINWVYELPSPGKGVLNAVAGGWSVSGLVSFQTGAPETLFIAGWDQNGDGEGFNDRPSLGNPGVPIDYSDACTNSGTVCSGVGLILSNGTILDWNSGAVGTADQFRYLINDYSSGINGNIGRNSFYYPGRQDWNLSVAKRFKLPMEGHGVEFRADFFNPFNHSNEGVSNIPTPFGSGFSNLNDTSNFLNMRETVRGARHIALWVKYSF